MKKEINTWKTVYVCIVSDICINDDEFDVVEMLQNITYVVLEFKKKKWKKTIRRKINHQS